MGAPGITGGHPPRHPPRQARQGPSQPGGRPTIPRVTSLPCCNAEEWQQSAADPAPSPRIPQDLSFLFSSAFHSNSITSPALPSLQRAPALNIRCSEQGDILSAINLKTISEWVSVSFSRAVYCSGTYLHYLITSDQRFYFLS